ncbi:hypothetical protein ACFVWG_13710 [Kribbella sp. NPDC058245]
MRDLVDRLLAEGGYAFDDYSDDPLVSTDPAWPTKGETFRA